MAPEVFLSEIYEFSADIYSFGIMLWEMWYGQQAFTNITSLAEFRKVIVNEGRRPEHDNKCWPPDFLWQALMTRCWKKNPTERPTAKECKEVMTRLYKTLEWHFVSLI